MLDILTIAKLVLDLCVQAFRLYRRNLIQPLMTAICLTGVYAIVHVTQEGSVVTGLRSAFLDNDASRADRKRVEAQATLRVELNQISVSNKMIEQRLESILQKAGASRVWLDVIHNGVTGMTGAGLLRFDVVNSVAAPGRAAGLPVTNQPLSEWSDALPTLLSGQCYQSRVSEVRSASMRARFESFDSTNVMICPANDIQGMTVAGIFVLWDGSDRVPDAEGLRSLIAETTRIGSQIAAVLDLRGPPPWPATSNALAGGTDQ